jgi:hypothetical protein
VGGGGGRVLDGRLQRFGVALEASGGHPLRRVI